MNYYPTIKQTFRLFGFLILMTFLFSILLKLIDDFVIDMNDSFINLLSYSLPIIITSYRYLKKKRKLNSETYLLKTNKVTSPIYIQMVILALMLMLIIDPLTVLIPVPDWFNELMNKMVAKDIYSFFTLVLIAPIFEELVFRGIILDGFLKSFSPKKSIIWSSLLFAIIHLNPWQAIGAFLIGLYIGWLYYRTYSIIPGILIHFVNNLIAFLIFLFSPDGAFTIVELFENKIIFMSIFIISCALFYFGIRYFNAQLNKIYAE